MNKYYHQEGFILVAIFIELRSWILDSSIDRQMSLVQLFYLILYFSYLAFLGFETTFKIFF